MKTTTHVRTIQLALGISLAVAATACGAETSEGEGERGGEGPLAVSQAEALTVAATEGATGGEAAERATGGSATTARALKSCVATSDGGMWCCIPGPVTPICWLEAPGPIWTVARQKSL